MDLFTGLGSLAGGLLGFMGAEEQADAMREANAAAGLRPWSPAEPYMTDFMTDAERLYQQQAFSPVANPLELLGRANTLGYAEDMLPGLVGAAQQSWQQGLAPGLNPYVAPMIQAAQNDLVQDFQRNVLPWIADQAQAAGGYGGSRQGVAEGIAAEGLLEALGDVSTNLLGNAYGQSLGQQQAAWSAMPSMLQAGFTPSAAQQDVGAQYRVDMMQPAANLQGYGSTMAPFFQLSPYAPAPVTQSPYGAALGGAMAGARMGDLFSTMQPAPPPAILNTPLGGTPGVQSNFFAV